MVVYFIRHRGHNPVKIGYAEDLSVRVRDIQVSSPWGIEVIASIETIDGRSLESKIHSKLKSFRMRGEWFNITDDHINDIISLYSNSDYIEARNNFEISYANRFKSNYIDEDLGFSIVKDPKNKIEYFLSQQEIHEKTGSDKRLIRGYIKSVGAMPKTRRISNDKVKNAYVVYMPY